jgi:diguanylate cyclase (GGDEF)-like protein
VDDLVLGVRTGGRRDHTWLSVSARPLADTGSTVVCTIADVTERRRTTDHIRRLAYLDSLTGLPNRELFLDRLAVAVVQARRQRQALAVLFVDLDHFKVINDSLGHSFGDAVLKTAAARLRGALRESDTVGRLGGDEFGAILPATGETTGVSRVALTVLDALRRPIAVEGRDLGVTASIGVALFPGDASDGDALLRCADTAMYRAKELGRNRTEFYTSALGARVRDQLDIDARLRKALEGDAAELHYQPIVNLRTGVLEGFEALLRWHDAEWGPVSPSLIIPVAETMGTILPLGVWSLRKACREIARVSTELGTPARVAVNLSARQFHEGNIVDEVVRALGEASLRPEALELEITERVALQGPEATLKTLRRLKEIGVRLAIDDFGTGYSSLGYLRQFPVDTLKIDYTFVRDAATDPGAAAIARTIVAMGHQLGLRVVAEGIETEDHFRLLRLMGCDAGQGYLLSRPVPPRALGPAVEDIALRFRGLPPVGPSS